MAAGEIPRDSADSLELEARGLRIKRRSARRSPCTWDAGPQGSSSRAVPCRRAGSCDGRARLSCAKEGISISMADNVGVDNR